MNMTSSTPQPFEPMQFRIIRCAEDLGRALARIDQLMTAPAGSEEGEELEVWAALVEKYEDSVTDFDDLDPIDAIEQAVELRGLKRADLVSVLGSPSRVTEVLGRQRKLTLGMIRRAHEVLGLPLELLVQPYELRRG